MSGAPATRADASFGSSVLRSSASWTIRGVRRRSRRAHIEPESGPRRQSRKLLRFKRLAGQTQTPCELLGGPCFRRTFGVALAGRAGPADGRCGCCGPPVAAKQARDQGRARGAESKPQAPSGSAPPHATRRFPASSGHVGYRTAGQGGQARNRERAGGGGRITAPRRSRGSPAARIRAGLGPTPAAPPLRSGRGTRPPPPAPRAR
jgi:hypothetical protein